MASTICGSIRVLGPLLALWMQLDCKFWLRLVLSVTMFYSSLFCRRLQELLIKIQAKYSDNQVEHAATVNAILSADTVEWQRRQNTFQNKFISLLLMTSISHLKSASICDAPSSSVKRTSACWSEASVKLISLSLIKFMPCVCNIAIWWVIIIIDDRRFHLSHPNVKLSQIFAITDFIASTFGWMSLQPHFHYNARIRFAHSSGHFGPLICHSHRDKSEIIQK